MFNSLFNKRKNINKAHEIHQNIKTFRDVFFENIFTIPPSYLLNINTAARQRKQIQSNKWSNIYNISNNKKNTIKSLGFKDYLKKNQNKKYDGQFERTVFLFFFSQIYRFLVCSSNCHEQMST